MRRCDRMARVLGMASMVACLGLLPSLTWGADTWVWSATDPASTDWSTPANWGGGVPGVFDRAVIRKAGDLAAVVTQPGAVCYTLDIARGAGLTNGLLKVVSGDLTVGLIMDEAPALDIGGDGIGTLQQTGGTVMVNGATSPGSWLSGLSPTGLGTYDLRDGTFHTGYMNVGMGGPGAYTQSGGAATVDYYTYIGRWTNGSCTVGGGTLNLGSSLTAPGDTALMVGYGVPGSVTQTGGTINTKGKVTLGYYANATYTMTGGLLNIGGITLVIGSNGGTATFTMGNETSSGTIATDTSAVSSADLYIGAGSSSTAALRGWGEIAMSWIYNNGTVIGDGYGNNRLLDMSLSERAHNYANTATSGWWAVNRGGVALPPILFDTVDGQPTQTWGGASIYSTSPNLINSASITITHNCQGNIRGALLAADRTDLPAFGDPNAKIIGVWDLAVNLNPIPTPNPNTYVQDLTNSTIAIRYDDARAAALGVSQSQLVIYEYLDGQWKALASTVDTANKIITANTDSFSLFAVGKMIPGDVNGDGVVNAADLSIVLAAMDIVPVTDVRADLDKDGEVTSTDLSIVLANMQ